MLFKGVIYLYQSEQILVWVQNLFSYFFFNVNGKRGFFFH